MTVRTCISRWTTISLVGTAFLAACSTDNPSSAPPEPCQLTSTTYGDLTIGSYTRPDPATITVDPTAPALPPPEPANVRVNISVNRDGVDLQFSGDGPVSWSTRTIAMAFDPTNDGTLSIAGSCLVQLDIWGVTASTSDGIERTIGTSRDEVAEVVRLPRRDDLTQVYIGLRSGDAAIAVHSHEGAEPSLTVART